MAGQKKSWRCLPRVTVGKECPAQAASAVVAIRKDPVICLRGQPKGINQWP
jgi:hypothetical protein